MPGRHQKCIRKGHFSRTIILGEGGRRRRGKHVFKKSIYCSPIYPPKICPKCLRGNAFCLIFSAYWPRCICWVTDHWSAQALERHQVFLRDHCCISYLACQPIAALICAVMKSTNQTKRRCQQILCHPPAGIASNSLALSWTVSTISDTFHCGILSSR